MRILECAAEGPRLNTARDAVELIAAASHHRPSMVVIPTEVLNDDFFRLKTRIAGEILQKFVTYQLRVVILGDISSHLGESLALRDFVVECNRGTHIWFLKDRAELGQRVRTKEDGEP